MGRLEYLRMVRRRIAQRIDTARLIGALKGGPAGIRYFVTGLTPWD